MIGNRLETASLILIATVLGVGCDELSAQAKPEVAEQIRGALAEPDRVERVKRQAEALQQADANALAAARDIYDEHIQGLDATDLQIFFDAWASHDAPSALSHAREIPFPLQAEIAQEAVIYTWATRDAASARAALEALPRARKQAGETRQRALVRGWALSGQAGLVDYVAGRPDADSLLLFTLPAVYQRGGADDLLAWLTEFIRDAPDPGARMKAFRIGVRTLAFRQPREAASFVADHYEEEYAKDGPRALVSAWLRREPDAALEWLRTEAPEDARAEALRLVINGWITRDSTAALDWLASRPADDPFYLPGYLSAAQWVVRRNGEEAVAWCERGPAPAPNRDCLLPVAAEWLQRNPDAAVLWLEQSALSEEDRVEARQRAKRQRRARFGRADDGGR